MVTTGSAFIECPVCGSYTLYPAGMCRNCRAALYIITSTECYDTFPVEEEVKSKKKNWKKDRFWE